MNELFNSLSDTQKEIVFNKEGKYAVRACPGSGKTYSISAKLAYLMNQWDRTGSGIAAISFTNVAWQEVEKKLYNNFNVNTPISYPHFLGTVDRFINQFIFLPFGHLIMECNKRPILVGQPHGIWSGGKYEKDYAKYFDSVSYNIEGELVKTEKAPIKLCNKHGGETGHVDHLKTTKKNYWKKGYATQDDANYISLRLLETYPKIAEALAYRFPQFMIDEAQDTTDIQMKIIDILIENGLEDIMMVGDPDQAIFEWNDANPQLFVNKFENWYDNSLILNENRRSSKKICDFTYNLSSLENASSAINPKVNDYDFDPVIEIYDASDLNVTIERFFNLCREHNIEVNKDNVAIIYRSKEFYYQIAGESVKSGHETPWLSGNMVAKEAAQGKYLYENNNPKEGFKIAEKAFYKILFKAEYCSQENLDAIVEKNGVVTWRSAVYEFITLLPAPNGIISNWIEEANRIFKEKRLDYQLKVDKNKGDITMYDLFKPLANETDLGFRTGTIHTVKGETFEAVLFILKKGGKGPYYKTMLRNGDSTLDQEELRIAYVAMTRPRKLLVLAVPTEDDKKAWQDRCSPDL